MSDLREIQAKCEQYWNAHSLCDEEVHAILEFIHSRATARANALGALRKILWFCNTMDDDGHHPILEGTSQLQHCRCVPAIAEMCKEVLGDAE